MPASQTSWFHDWLRRLYLLVLVAFLLPVAIPQAKLSPRAANWSDAEGYYLYLPGVFSLPSVHHVKPVSMWLQVNDWGAPVIKYTCGVAVFEAPLFLVARTVADSQGVDRRDIFQDYYCWAIYATAFLVAWAGLWLLQRALRQRGFAEPVVALTLVGTLFGTNLFHYIIREPGMSHVYSFCLMAALAWHTPRFYARPSLVRGALLGGIFGWLILIRPTAVAALPFVVFYDIYRLTDVRPRLLFLLRQWQALAVGAVVGFLFLSLQLAYWHELTGHWISYSYRNEGFPYWMHPKIAAVLFDSQNGLFIYSPLVLLSMVGLVLGWRERRFQAPALTLIFVIITYVFASWWAWWFGGAFGHRCYVEYYALLAFPLAGTFEKLLALRSRAVRSLAFAGIAFLLFYALRLDFLYEHSRPWDGADWRWSLTKLKGIWSQLFSF
jgi:hypothetical protein